jgi:L-threonylcarbamoyladenylate synthase
MVKRYSDKEIDKLADILINDGVICIPTDTVYGICGKINSKIVYEKLIEIKGRPENKPFPVMCADKKQINDIAVLDERSEKIIDAFMPGPLTVVLKRKDSVEDYVTNGRDTIAIRIAMSDVLVDLINRVGCPLFLTSANRSGEKECSNLDEIEERFPLLDGLLKGDAFWGQPSTIIDCSEEDIKVLREGPISIKDICEKIK